nr:glycosyltransferase family 39 protein [Anaerolineae bacterium]
MEPIERGYHFDRAVWIILALALLIRVFVMVAVFSGDDYAFDDSAYYVSIAQEPWRLGIPADERDYDKAAVTVGPIYPAFLIPIYNWLNADIPAQTTLTRIIQAVLDVIVALLVYLIAYDLFGKRVAIIALVMQALDLRYVFMAGTVATETMYVILFVAFIWLYLRAVSSHKMGAYALAGVLLGVANLTRPVPLVFPLFLLPHVLLIKADRRKLLRGIGIMVLVMVLIITPWIVRTGIITGEATPISASAFVHFWMNSRPDGDLLGTEDSLALAALQDMGYGADNPHLDAVEYLAAAVLNILKNPGPFASRVITRLLEAYRQPYGTVILVPRGAGVKAVARAFLAGEASLWEVLSVPGFWRKLLMYIWHFWGLVFGTVGIAIALKRREWAGCPLAAWIVYVSGMMSMLLVEPRYLMPIMFAFTVFAAKATDEMIRAVQKRRLITQPEAGR